MKTRFNVEGMSCVICAQTIEREVKKIKGVKNAEVNFAKNEMIIETDSSLDDEIIKKVESIGYKAYTGEKNIKKKDKKIINLVVSFVLLLFLMYFSMGEMLSFPLPSILISNKLYLALIELILSLSIMILHYNYYIDGIKHLFKLNPDMSSLVSLGSLSSLIIGIIGIMYLAFGDMTTGIAQKFANNLYFDSAAMIVCFVSLGKYIEAKAKDKTRESIEELEKLESKQTRIVLDNQEFIYNTKDVPINSLILVKAGERIPLDGIVEMGKSTIDESTITGESVPSLKEVGSKVISSTINIDGALYVRTTSIDKSSTIRRIIDLVNEASSSKSKMSNLADKISRIFVPSVMAISLITFIVNLLITKDVLSSLNYAITVLVVSCPCALGLATPIAILVGSGKAAREGYIVNSINSLEKARKIKTIVFDKTGTLTEGKPKVIDELIFKNIPLYYEILYSLEKNTNHPYGEAILNKSKPLIKEELKLENYQYIIGGGVKGTYNNIEYFIGSKSFLISNLDIKEEQVKDKENEGISSLYFFTSKELISIIYIEDTIRENSKELVELLNKKGNEVIMLTGDSLVVANSIAKRLGIKNVMSNVSPETKINVISSLKEKNEVLMVGDGINDTAAIKMADVGVSLGSATDAAKSSADIILLHNNIFDVYNVLRLSNRIVTTIKINLFWAFIYNIISIFIATGMFRSFEIEINPMIASIMMSFSSVFVVLTSLTINLFKPIKEEKKNMEKVTIKIEGMMCEHCVMHVHDALMKVQGVSNVSVSLKDKEAVVEGKDLNMDALVSSVKEAGYKAEIK